MVDEMVYWLYSQLAIFPKTVFCSCRLSKFATLLISSAPSLNIFALRTMK